MPAIRCLTTLSSRTPVVGPRNLLTLLVAALLAVAGVAALRPDAASAAVPSGFVTRCGIHFCLDGRTYYVAGANTYDLFTYGSGSGDTETQYMDKSRIDAQFASLQADKVGVVRLWMFSHESWHGFEPSKGVYNEQEFAQFDYIIQSAKAHGIRLLPVFENYWEAYGGIDTRLSWEGLSGGQPGRAAFFDKTRCPGCFTSYKNYISYALNRTNHYSGVKYKDDPTIFAWELMNEPRYQDQSTAENAGGTTLRAWVDEMGAYVKSIDPNHMLDAGLEGHGTKYGFGGDEGNPFVYVQESPYIDFTSAHPYTTEEWANLSLDQTKALIRSWISDSHNVVGKPFFMGEFNVKNVDRSTWWSGIYSDFEAADGDGSAFWWYMDRQVDPTYGVMAGAPELAVFRAHSERMAAKSGGTATTPPTTPPPTTAPPTTTPPTTAPPTSTPPTSTPPTSTGCVVTYKLSDWGTSFNADVTVKNNGSSAINGWTLVFSFPAGQTINSIWNAKATQSGKQVTVTNEAWTGSIAAGATVNFGLNGGSSPGTNGVPTAFTLNGAGCSLG
ncbi:cellulose binding domain-containing protein [Peterkaempfera sp. SMS 1(5)a]|uniref:cellulose binding domain-containing protein n=1 Tax=Peterkaempfera podocarpi TaxID=3232308 RepID=UPI00366AB6C2